ncbi:MAG: class I SAM-dependent methyltransferase [Rhodospirillales bacterium]
MQQFNRFNPSPRYRELIGLYQTQHTDGDRLNGIPAEKTFDGQSLRGHVVMIAQIAANFAIHTVLDYGSGKAQGYANWKGKRDGKPVTGLKAIWGVDEITLYDPAYEPHSALPAGKFDLVICTDVLEHCPEQDIPWIVGEILGLSERFVFCTVATYPAKKHLPNGENAHITLKPPAWWKDVFEEESGRHFNRTYNLAVKNSSDGRADVVKNY